MELPFYIFFTLFRGCKARGYGGGHGVAFVCVKGIIITLPQKSLTGWGILHTVYQIPNTVLRIPYIEYRIPYSVFNIPYTVYRIPYLVFGLSNTVLRILYTVYRIPYTEYRTQCSTYCIAYTVYRMPALFLTHCCHYLDTCKANALRGRAARIGVELVRCGTVKQAIQRTA